MNYKYFILPLCMALTACNLDLKPENGLTYTNSFDTEKELNATTSSIHFFLNSAVADEYTLMNAGVIADEVRDGQQLREWNPNSVVGSSDWKDLYTTIFESNLLLDNIGRTQGLSEERKNYHEGQAYFALGLSYLTLVQRYGDVPLMENSSVVKEYEATPQLQVLDAAIEYAKKGLEILATYDKLRDINGTTITSKQFASKGSCATLLAHLYAWKGSIIELYELSGDAKEAFKLSNDYATKVINGEAGNYALLSDPEELCQKLSDPTQSNTEVIFSAIFDVNRSSLSVTPNIVASSYLSWPVNELNLLGDIQMDTPYLIYKSTIDEMYGENDQRRKAYFYDIDEDHSVDGTNYALMYKFRNCIYEADQFAESGKAMRSLNADYVLWRLADLYLLRAENNAKLGNNTEAITDLNVIRSRAAADTYPADNDTEDVRKAIFNEREKEFLYENNSRYFDVIRNYYYNTELQGKFSVLTKQDVKDGALVLPVPSGGVKDKDGQVVNTKLRQKPYWNRYAK